MGTVNTKIRFFKKYFAKRKIYRIYTEKRKLNLFSSTLQKIPTPQYIVFYNGLKNEPDRKILKLSDAFMNSGGCLECSALMVNINYGHNRELMEKCRRLEEYALFVATVRKYATDEKLTLGDAITLAIDECMEKEILLDILKEERAEVFMYILESFDKELYERDLKADAYEDGVKAGESNKLVSQIKIKLQKGKNVEQIADELEESLENIQNLVLQLESEK